MWITAKVNDEVVGTLVHQTSGFGVVHTLNAAEENVAVETSTYADVFESVLIENAEAGTRRCTLCSMDEDEANNDPECPGDGTTDHDGHVIGHVYMSWFEGAKVEVDEQHERITVELRVAGKRFQMYVTRLADDVSDGGALVLEVPGEDPNVLRRYRDSTTNRVIVGTEPTTATED